MKKIEIFERAMNEGGNLKDYGINSTMFAAYRDCPETGNEHIDFNCKGIKGKRHQRIYNQQYIFEPYRNPRSI